ncbi:MAG TPA: hypothetical protein VHB50_05335 [Bryobacteraceae bacterium]|nr:hypothetical protein [Bryobacteraceae bacterium]
MSRLLAVLLLVCAAVAQTNRYNFDESRVAPYKLPDPLVLSNGQRVRDAKTWNEQRRPELMAIFEDQVYGKTPLDASGIRFSQTFVEPKALKGKAIRKQVTVYFTPHNDGPRMDVLIYLPAAAKGPVPVFVGLNFNGNQTVANDPAILTNDVWLRDPAGSGKWMHLPPDDRTRGANASNWQVEKILSHGYGLATVYYCDIEPDFDGGAQYGVRSLLPDPQSWSALGAWAWGLSRVVDYLHTDKTIDPKRIALIGHSRLGKAALWAAAQDQRFSLVISNESGKGGASLLKRTYGETTDHLNTAFPHWFCANYKQYTGHPEKLPVDGNDLLALIAPRPLYVASAEEDRGSDPKGEFLSAASVGHVYALFGKKGLGTNQMPPVNQPIMHDVGYHVRTGKHDVTDYDWDQYLAFADMHWAKGSK